MKPHPAIGDRDGATFVPARDRLRLNKQAQKIFDLLVDGKWWTLRDLADVAGCPEASASARIRDLKKERFGRHIIEKEYVTNGLWRYRMILPEPYQPRLFE